MSGRLSARVTRLEGTDPPRRVSVWDVIAGVRDPSELTGDDLEMWRAFTEVDPKPNDDPIEAEIRAVSRRELPPANPEPPDEPQLIEPEPEE